MDFNRKNKIQLLNFKQICCLIIFLFASVNYSFAQIDKVFATLDSNKILIGEQITLTLVAKSSPGTLVVFPNLKDHISEEIELVRISKIDSLINNTGEGLLTQKIKITSFDSGLYTIPKLPFKYKTNNIESVEYSQELMLYVNNIRIKPNKGIITTLRPNYNTPITFIEIFVFVIIILAISAASYFGYKYIKKQKGDKPVFTFRKPPPPPHVTAINKLDKLKDEKLWQKGKIKVYYTSLTEILRVYLEGRYHISAMEQTTEEIMNALKKTDFNDNRLYDQLNEILTTADFVKFAKANPDPNENESSLLNAYSFVNDTKLIEVAPLEEHKPEVEEGKEVEDDE